ncbi:MAG: SemiSWEET transporter [Candidatus Omnitrophota bacterium]
MFWSMLGIIAASLTMFAFIPQIIKAVKTKSVKDVSIITLFQLSLGVSLWVLYGIHLADAIIILANSFTLLSLIILLYLYFSYGRSK